MLMPRRRTFAAALQASAHSEETFASRFLAALGFLCRQEGMGNPDQGARVEVPKEGPPGVHRAGANLIFWIRGITSSPCTMPEAAVIALTT